MDTVDERLRTPVCGEYDLIVAGGGIAGVSAAVQAKRAGVERVLLLEKSYTLGGLATHGLVTLYEPLCDGHGKRISYGMAEELLRRFTEYGTDSLPAAWRGIPESVPEGSGRCKGFYSEAYSLIALDSFVTEAGVDLLFDSKVCAVETDGTRCTGVVTENTEGRAFYRTRAVIDATGDASLLMRMGVPCRDGKNAAALIMKTVDPESMQRALKSGNVIDLYRHHMLLSSAMPYGLKSDPGAGFIPVTGGTSKEVTDFMLYVRKKALEATMDGVRMTRDIAQLPMMPQLRTIRHIEGEYTVTDSDKNRMLPDSVSPVADFLTSGEWYEIPYRSLYRKGFPNVWAAGRITAAEGWAWMVVRVIPGCIASGQAAGMAAALCLERGDSAESLPYPVLKDALENAGVRTHVH